MYLIYRKSRIMKNIFTAVILSSCIAFSAFAGTSPDPEIISLREKAEKGDPYSQGMLSGICRRG